MPRSAIRRAVPTPLLRALPLLAAAACSPSPAVAPSLAVEALPPTLALRSDSPYVTGTIVRREEADGAPRLLVRSAEGASAFASRVPEAVVRVHADSLLTYRDGRAAPAGELTVGRLVTVWVRGPESRSLPPQVTASAILLERR
jgi:hypothetical protein